MIRLTCDKCERTLSVDDNLAGTKYECPHCGDTNLVPDRSDPATDLGLPPQDAPEETLFKVHPAMFRAHPIRGLGVVLIILAAMAGGTWLLFDGRSQLAILPTVVAVVGAGYLLFWRIQTLAVTLTVTNKRTIRNVGLFSKSTSEVRHESIRNFQLDQTFWERVLNVGSIGISSSGQNEIEITVDSIANPLKIRNAVNAYRR